MAQYDIFNGDADGLCALRQWRGVRPAGAVLVTGAKREVRLLERVPAAPGDHLLVLDVAVGPNRPALDSALAIGARVTWFDHHHPGQLPVADGLETFIDTDPAVCTSLLVDRHLQGAARPWAIAGAFGDNLAAPARALAVASGLAAERTDLLRRVGECLNYNAYGDSVDELLFAPAALWRRLASHAQPWDFAAADDAFTELERAMHEDMSRALALAPQEEGASGAVLQLPDEAWSRRVSGTLANRLARSHPGRAHAVLTPSRGRYTVSIRAPLERPAGAARLASAFEGGGGREGAAGINGLPEAELGRFLEAFRAAYP